MTKYVNGIDISKDKFDACLISVDLDHNYQVKATHKFGNTPAGFKELLLWLKKHCKEEAVQTIMEASGVYHEKLAIWLTEKDQPVYVVLPNRAHQYMKVLGLKSKNDKIDALGLALMGAHHKFDLWQPITKFYYELRLLTRHHQSLQKGRTEFMNQRHALQHSGYSSHEVMTQLDRTVALFEKQIKDSKQYIKEYINRNEDVKRKVSHACKIKGVDVLTVATIIAETSGFELFKNSGQLISYTGYDVVENQSGKHIGRTSISKRGNSRIRRILHMPAFNVVRFNQTPFVNLYQRIYANTKIKMKAYVAVQKKLLVIIYSLWKKDQPYQPDYNNPIQTSGNDESRAFFPFFSEEKRESCVKAVVPPIGGTTQDEHRSKESPEALFPYFEFTNSLTK